jgi:hypothetical protein
MGQKKFSRFTFVSPEFGVSSTLHDIAFRPRGEGVHLSLIFMNIFDSLVIIVLTADQE